MNNSLSSNGAARDYNEDLSVCRIGPWNSKYKP